GFLAAEGLEHDSARLEPSGAPTRPVVEELGPRETEDEDGGIADPGRQVLDQIKERRLGPVDVFENEEQRLARRLRLDPAPEGPGDFAVDAATGNRGLARQTDRE